MPLFRSLRLDFHVDAQKGIPPCVTHEITTDDESNTMNMLVPCVFKGENVELKVRVTL
jgi:hypothetical protein